MAAVLVEVCRYAVNESSDIFFCLCFVVNVVIAGSGIVAWCGVLVCMTVAVIVIRVVCINVRPSLSVVVDVIVIEIWNVHVCDEALSLLLCEWDV